MVIAHCTRCLGKAQGETFEVASSKINHAVSLSRGIPCGDNYNCVEELKDTTIETKQSPKKIAKDPNVVISNPDNSSKTTSSKKSKKQY